jgi:hypothetical protein
MTVTSVSMTWWAMSARPHRAADGCTDAARCVTQIVREVVLQVVATPAAPGSASV